MKTLAVGLVVDTFISGLDIKTRKLPYVRKELRKLTKKNHGVARDNGLRINKAFEIANKAWLDAQLEVQRKHKDGLPYSTVYVVKQLLPYINSYYKLNPKNWEKLYNRYDFKGVTFSSIRVANALLLNIDQEIARYEYNRRKATT